MNDPRRQLPKISVLLDSAALKQAAGEYGVTLVRDAARETVDSLRRKLVGGQSVEIPSVEQLAASVAQRLNDQERLLLRPVINATGILLHTNLGRAPLPQAAIEEICRVAQGYCNVELDLKTGSRTQRTRSVEGLLCELTGAEAAHVVNNTAGATGLVLSALTTGREVIVSHGQLIEIGGGFRLPEVISAYGAILRPVGTTNRTRLADYAEAIHDNTGALFVAHPSNYRIVGFTEQPSIQALASLPDKVERNLPLIHDTGSGVLRSIAGYDFGDEPVASQSLQDGADVVLFSGDKLLGGPQCGIILGRAEVIHRISRHPMSRALRVDKLTLAALRATLSLYRTPETLHETIPLHRFLKTTTEELVQRAGFLQGELRGLPDLLEVIEDAAYVGGGSLPEESIPSVALRVRGQNGSSPEELASKLRLGDPSVVGRVQGDALILNLHAVSPHPWRDQGQTELEWLAAALREVLQ